MSIYKPRNKLTAQVHDGARIALSKAREQSKASCRVYTAAELAAFARTMGKSVSDTPVTTHKDPTKVYKKLRFGTLRMKPTYVRTGTT